MLYDNGQLLTLYSEAYRATGNELYRDIIDETAGFILRELTDESGAFFSALDADSEGEEGKFYTWTKDELETIAVEDMRILEAYYHIDRRGLWEH